MSTAAGNPKPVSSKSIDLLIWNVLGGSPAITFGEECASVAVWTMVALLMRTILYFSFMEPYVPYGLVYAFPMFIELLSSYFPFLRSSYPILPYRIAECFIGKVMPSQILVLIPAHLLGAIFGAVTIKTVLPFLPNVILRPIEFPASNWAIATAMELVVSFAYCLILLVVPHLFEVNRVSTKLVALTMLPVFLIKAPVFCSTLNPSIIYGLWYLHNSSSLLNIMNTLPFEHIVGPILGAVLAGLVCNVYFPDDPKSWTRSRSK